MNGETGKKCASTLNWFNWPQQFFDLWSSESAFCILFAIEWFISVACTQLFNNGLHTLRRLIRQSERDCEYIKAPLKLWANGAHWTLGNWIFSSRFGHHILSCFNVLLLPYWSSFLRGILMCKNMDSIEKSHVLTRIQQMDKWNKFINIFSALFMCLVRLSMWTLAAI